MTEYCEQAIVNKMLALGSEEPVLLDQWQDFVVGFDDVLRDGKATFNLKPIPQSVNEEYSTYVMGALRADSTPNALSFWSVSLYMEFTRID